MTETHLLKTWFRRLWWLIRYFSLALLVLIAVYGVARLVHVSLGSLYDGSRGPYLQMLSDSGVTLRWQSQTAYVSAVRYGREPHQLDRVVRGRASTTQHELRLGGLSPQTRYYYELAGQDADNGLRGSFVTSARAGSETPIRFWVTGDPGYYGPIQTAVKQTAWQWLAQNPRPGRGAIDFWLTTGDNAYTSGTNQQFQDNFFTPYAEILARYAVWPAYGNHDARRWAFFDIFSLPTNAEAGGTASHTEHYYSFDYGQLHVVMLDSEASSLSPHGPMARWLQTDLKATDQPWRIVVLHHPPYTKGSHDSDRREGSGGRLPKVRENLLPLLERLGVDMVLAGHSHMYERSHALACHYQDTSTWTPEYQRDTSSPYRKGSGTVYMVLGSSSKLDQGPLDHPALPIALHQAGSVIIDLDNDRLTSRFINQQGEITDQFQIIKDGRGPTPGVRYCE
ncbi:MAG: metallophosphoesterase family protein [Gammaproteobacteria bacterium]